MAEIKQACTKQIVCIEYTFSWQDVEEGKRSVNGKFHILAVAISSYEDNKETHACSSITLISKLDNEAPVCFDK